MIQRRLTPANALARLEELCARSEQCSCEVLAKLASWGITPDVAGKILKRLKADRFVDDERYARAFAHDKLAYNRWGKIKIRQALALKRIDSDLIAQALGEIDGEEYVGALTEVIAAKASGMQRPLSFDDGRRLLRYAASRGFEAGLALDVIKHPELWDSED